MPVSKLYELANYDSRARDASGRAAQAFARLLKLAEDHESGQARRIADFVATTFNGRSHRFDPFELRAVDVDVSDDMLCCLDALRWGRSDLYRLVPDGEARVRAVIRKSARGQDDRG
jgi:hypothetical protein